MDEAADLTLLSGTVQEIAREMRLLRPQVENLAARMATMDQRSSILEQGLDRLISEVSRGFGRMQQQPTRNEKRFDAVDAGLAEILAAVRGTHRAPGYPDARDE